MKNHIIFIALFLSLLFPCSPLVCMLKTTSELHTAARKNQLKELVALLQTTRDINAQNDEGYTALHCAASNGHQKAIALLLSFNADAHARTYQGETPLQLAQENGHDGVVALLQSITPSKDQKKLSPPSPVKSARMSESVPADVNQKDKKGKSRLHIAVEKGLFNEVKRLLQQGANVSISDDDGCTPLHYAASACNELLCKLLIDNKAPINAPSKGGSTPLHYCVSEGDEGLEVAELLISRGAQVNAKEDDGRTPLHCAAYSGDKALLVVDLLFQHGANPNAITHTNENVLHLLAYQTDGEAPLLQLAQLLIEQGVDTNARDDKGAPPLAMAVYNGTKALGFVQTLLANGADPNAQDDNGDSLLCNALLAGDKALSCAELLLEYGAIPKREETTGAICMPCEDDAPLLYALLSNPVKRTMKTVKLKTNDSKKLVSEKRATRVKKTALVRAVENSFVDEVAALLESGVDVNAKNSEGETALHKAADLKNSTLCKLLLKKKAAINATDENGFTPLHCALARCDSPADYEEDNVVELLDILIGAGASINAKASGGMTPLFIAVEKECVAAVKKLLAHGADPNILNNYATSYLIRAVEKSNLEISTLLVRHKADPNSKDTLGNTPLHYAAKMSSKELVTLLIKNGANIHVKDELDETPLEAILIKSEDPSRFGYRNPVDVTNKETVNLLLSYGAKSETLRRFYGHEGEITLRQPMNAPIEQKVQSQPQAIKSHLVNGKDSEGKTPLHRATEKGDLENLSSLLDQGANPNATNNKGGTPLHAAAYAGHTSLCSLLIKRGSSLDIQNQFGNTPLHVAAIQGHQEICSALLEARADASLKNNNGHTALQAGLMNKHAGLKQLFEQASPTRTIKEKRTSAQQPHPVVIKQTLHYEEQKSLESAISPVKIASTERVNEFGCTKLHDAAAGNKLSKAKTLINKGADVNAKSNQGETPLIKAALYGHNEMIALFIEHGADVNAQAMFGVTALHQAALTGKEMTVRLLLAHGANPLLQVQGETPFDIATRKGHTTVARLLKNPPQSSAPAAGAGTNTLLAAISAKPPLKPVIAKKKF